MVEAGVWIADITERCPNGGRRPKSIAIWMCRDIAE